MSADTSFTFSPENAEQAAVFIARYPEGRQQSAVMPLLDLAQRQAGGWLPREVLDYVADYLDMPRIRVYEVANLLHHVQHQAGRSAPGAAVPHDAVLAARLGGLF